LGRTEHSILGYTSYSHRLGRTELSSGVTSGTVTNWDGQNTAFWVTPGTVTDWDGQNTAFWVAPGTVTDWDG